MCPITKKLFKEIHLYTVLMREISTIFIDQLQHSMLSEKCMLYVGIKFSTIYHLVS